MDDIVVRSLAKWPEVPAVYGWLALDRRGNWLIRTPAASHRFERIGNAALREFIGRNYEHDDRGRWFFQNGPQRVYVRLAYTPLVVRHDGAALVDHCGRSFHPTATWLDDEGSLLMGGGATVALLDDRDLARYADAAQSLPVLARERVPEMFGFEPDPAPN